MGDQNSTEVLRSELQRAPEKKEKKRGEARKRKYSPWAAVGRRSRRPKRRARRQASSNTYKDARRGNVMPHFDEATKRRGKKKREGKREASAAVRLRLSRTRLRQPSTSRLALPWGKKKKKKGEGGRASRGTVAVENSYWRSCGGSQGGEKEREQSRRHSMEKKAPPSICARGKKRKKKKRREKRGFTNFGRLRSRQSSVFHCATPRKKKKGGMKPAAQGLAGQALVEGSLLSLPFHPRVRGKEKKKKGKKRKKNNGGGR